MSEATPQAPQQPAPGKMRRARTKAPARRIPVYALGSELSVDERLARFTSETEVVMSGIKAQCAAMSAQLQEQRKRLSQAEATPERRRLDQFVGSIKHKAETIARELSRLHEDLEQRNRALRLECEVERARLLVEREQRGRTNMHWAHAGGLITTPHQRRLQESGAKAEQGASAILELTPKAEQSS